MPAPVDLTWRIRIVRGPILRPSAGDQHPPRDRRYDDCLIEFHLDVSNCD